MQTFAGQLSAIRKERCLTQEQLAQALNVSRTTISRWESGKALPDIETIKQLSQVLNYNFFTVEDLGADTPDVDPPPAPQEDPPLQGSPAPGRRHRRTWIWLIFVAVLFLLAAFLLGGRMPPAQVSPTATATATPSPTAAPTAAPTATPAESAVIVVTPSKKVAYLENFPPLDGKEDFGWIVDFYIKNKSDIPFQIEKVVALYYENDLIRFSIPWTYEALRPNMQNDKLHRTDPAVELRFNTNQLYLTHITVTVYGTDDLGNKLEASTTVPYSHETDPIAE